MSSNTHTDVLLAGAIAAFTVDLIVYPLDTLKTRFQSPDYKNIYYNASRNSVNRQVLFRGLYQGIGSIILITIPSSGAFFTTYEAVKSGLSKINPSFNGAESRLIPQPLVNSAASAIAELASCFILTPAEVLKQNAQMIRRPTSAKTSANTVFQPSVTLEALRRFKKPSQLFRGYTALAARNLPFTAIQFPMYEHLKESIKAHRTRSGTSSGRLGETATITAISAGSAGAFSAILTTPLDVIKTRIMLSAGGDGAKDQARQTQGTQQPMTSTKGLAQVRDVPRKSSIAIAREIYQEGGTRGLFRGVTLRAVWTALGSGLYLAMYESSRIWLGERHEDKSFSS